MQPFCVTGKFHFPTTVLDSLPCTARAFLLFSNFRNMPGKAKPSLPSFRSFFFLTFRDFLQVLLQMPERLTKPRDERGDADKLPACISSRLPLPMARDATAQNQGLFRTPAGSYTWELGQPNYGWWVAVPSSRWAGMKSLTHLPRHLRWVSRCASTAWQDKIRLLHHVAPQQRDFETQALPPSSLSNLIASSRDGICTDFVPFRSLISSKGSVSHWLDFVSLSCGCI